MLGDGDRFDGSSEFSGIGGVGGRLGHDSCGLLVVVYKLEGEWFPILLPESQGQLRSLH